MGIAVAAATVEDLDDWVAMRHALWPKAGRSVHRQEIAALLAAPSPGTLNLIARLGPSVCGFAEARLRHDYVNGCDSSPVAFLEGIFVTPEARRQGIARALVAAAEAWAAQLGCTEFASDAAIENTASAAMHARLGFEETQRVVYFRKRLGG